MSLLTPPPQLNQTQKALQVTTPCKKEKFDPTLKGLSQALLAHVLSFLHPVEIKPYKRFSAEGVKSITNVAALSRHFRDFFTKLIKTTTLRSQLAKFVSHLNVRTDNSSCPPFDSPFWENLEKDLPAFSICEISADSLSGAKGAKLCMLLKKCLSRMKANTGLTLRIPDTYVSDLTALAHLAGKVQALQLPKAIYSKEPTFFHMLGALNRDIPPPPPPHFMQHIEDSSLNLREFVTAASEISSVLKHVESIKSIQVLGLIFQNSYVDLSVLRSLLQALPNLKCVDLQFPQSVSLLPNLDELTAVIFPERELRITEFTFIHHMESSRISPFTTNCFQNNLHRFRALERLNLGVLLNPPLLNMLQSLPQLKTVNLLTDHGVEFTQEAINRLTQTLPLCRITLDGKLVGKLDEKKEKRLRNLQEAIPPAANILDDVWQQLSKVSTVIGSWFTSWKLPWS